MFAADRVDLDNTTARAPGRFDFGGRHGVVGAPHLDHGAGRRPVSPRRASPGPRSATSPTACGILSGSLYHYFPVQGRDSELIVTQYLDALVDEYKRSSRPSNGPRERLDDLVKASFRVSQAHPHASEIYQTTAPIYAS